MEKLKGMLEQVETSSLLRLLAKGRAEIKCSFEKGDEFGEKTKSPYHALGTLYAPVACELFKRFWPRLPPYLSINLSRSSDCFPDSVGYWDDPDAITGIYEALEKDGYYQASPQKENLHASA